MKNFLMTLDKFKDSTRKSQNFPYSEEVPLHFWSYAAFAHGILLKMSHYFSYTYFAIS